MRKPNESIDKGLVAVETLGKSHVCTLHSLSSIRAFRNMWFIIPMFRISSLHTLYDNQVVIVPWKVAVQNKHL